MEFQSASPESGSATPAPARRAKAVRLAVLGLLCAGFVWHVLRYDFVADDTFITLRYAQNLAAGNGPVFNVGDRVEGFSSATWMVLLAALHWVGLDLLVAARVVGVLFGVGTVLLVERLVILASPSGRVPAPIAAIAPLLVAANGSFACWAGSGMETTLWTFLIVGTGVALLGGRLGVAAALASLLIFTRPESPLLLLAFTVYLLHHRGDRRPWLSRARVWLMACVGSLAVLLGARFLYYGEWLPNTYYAKVGGGPFALVRGLDYLADYAADHEGLVSMAVPIAWGLLAGGAGRRVLCLVALAAWSATVVVGGDGLPMYRFALPALPLVAVLQALLIADLFAIRAARATVLARRVVAVVAVVLLVVVQFTPPAISPHYGLYHLQRNVELPRWTAAGKWLRDHRSPGESVAAVPIGAVAFYSGLIAYDMMGLTDRRIARREMPGMGHGFAGHEKHDGQYILSLRPTYLLVDNVSVTRRPLDPQNRPFVPYGRAAWEREGDLYDTDLIDRLYEPRSVPLGPDQFLNFYQLRGEHRPARDLR
jgi:hypothetical protein